MAVAPGLMRTPGTTEVTEEEFAAVQSVQSLARPLVPDDVAETVGFLATREAAALTGRC
jgi:3-oxoacyl-[acyl-carrier protein] reductase